MYRHYNPHPKGVLTEDCVVRALQVCTGFPYERLSRQLAAFRKVTGAKTKISRGNPHRFAEDVLEAKRIDVSAGTTVETFCREHPHGRFVLDLEAHWCGCVEGDLYDTWDCGKERVNFAYEIDTENFVPPAVETQVFRYCCTSKPISDKETQINIYDGNGRFATRIIPTPLTEGYVRCLQDEKYEYIELSGETL
jgi:hypothetical protein